MTPDERLAEIEQLERHMRQRGARYEAYCYGFEPTEEAAVDRILAALARAGTAYHHTADWGEPLEEGLSVVDLIQSAANVAASELRDARAEIEMKSERAGLFRDAYRDLRSRVRAALGLPQMLASIDQKDVQLREIETAAQKLVTDLAAERAKAERVEALCDEYRTNCDPDTKQAQVAEIFRAALAGGEQGE